MVLFRKNKIKKNLYRHKDHEWFLIFKRKQTGKSTESEREKERMVMKIIEELELKCGGN